MVYLILIIFITCFLLSQVKRDIPVEKLMALYAGKYSCFFIWNGMAVHYKDEGQGIPILLLHGTSASLHTWDSLTDNLKDQYRIIRVDLPGHGLTGPQPARDYSLTMYAQFIHDLMAHLGIERFIIGGNSWGGMLAWYYAILHTPQITGLILIDAAGYKMKLVPKRFKLSQHAMGRLILRHTLPVWMIKAGLREVVQDHHIIDKAMIRRCASLNRRTGNRQAFIDLMRLREHPDPRLLSRVSSPALVLWGQYDKLYPIKQAYAFGNLLSRSIVGVIDNAGHIPMEEDPKVCAKHIRDFVNIITAYAPCVHLNNTTG